MHVSKLMARSQEFIWREASVDGVLLVGADCRLVAAADKLDGACRPYCRTPRPSSGLSAVPPGAADAISTRRTRPSSGCWRMLPLRFASVRDLVVRRTIACTSSRTWRRQRAGIVGSRASGGRQQVNSVICHHGR